MHTDPQAAQPVTPKQRAPLWMKLMLVTITILASLQLGKDLGGLDLSTVAANGIGSIFQVLGESTVAASPGRLAGFFDSYNMCQNKLGIDTGAETNGQAFGDGDFEQQDKMMKQLYVLGFRYFQITVRQTSNTDITNVIRLVQMANGNHLTPLLYLQDSGGSGIDGKVSVISNFYSLIDQGVGGGRNFIAASAPRSVIDAGQWTDAIAIANGVAAKLDANSDISLATPELRVYDKNGGDQSGVTNPPDDFVGTVTDEVKTFVNQGGDISKFDLVLLGYKNFDSAYGNGISSYNRRGYFFYSNDGPPNNFVKAKELINGVNNDKKINIRALVMDFGPSDNPDTTGGDKLRERMAYDFGSFSDDFTVQGVVFAKEVANKLITKSNNPPPTPDDGVRSCKVGENFASIAGVGAGPINNVADIGYGLAEVIINGPGDVGAAIGDANSMCAKGMTPVIRSCIIGNCGFTSGGQQAEALKNIANGASVCASKAIQPYMVCGHNEVESEFDGKFKEEGAWSHACLNGMSGANAKVTSTIFNATHPDHKQQAADWLAGFGGKPTGFDCIMFNSYTIFDGGSFVSAISFINTFVADAPTFKGLPFCISETGIADNAQTGKGKTTGLAIEAVEGLLQGGAKFVLGFNFTGHNPGWEGFHLNDDGRALTKALCNASPSDKAPETLDTSKLVDFFGFINTYGNNCDYDTQPVKTVYDDRAKAASCDSTNTGTAGESAKTKVVCTSPDSCYGTVRYTVQVGLPIRSYASNSAVGTQTHPYQPYSVRATQFGLGQYDLSNQYAYDLISSTGTTYAMPWLGSALFINGQISKTEIGAEKTATDRKLTDSVGSYISQTALEEKSEITRGNWVWGYNNTTLSPVQIPLERALCIGSICFDKYKALNDVYARQATYDADALSVTSKAVNKCGGTVARADYDPQNMVYGTENVLGTDIWSGSGAQLCYEDWLPDDTISGDGLSCSTTGGSECYCNEWDDPVKRAQALALGASSSSFFISENNVRSGSCHASGGKVATCIHYNGGANSFGESQVKYKSTLPAMPSYSIPGVYDSLANLYRIVQNNMSQQGLKIIFNELPEAAWQSDVILKAYSETPGSDHVISTPRSNNMLEDFGGKVEGLDSTNSCSTKFMLFGDSVAGLQANTLGLTGNYNASFPGASSFWFFSEKGAHGNPDLNQIFSNDAEYAVINIGTNDCANASLLDGFTSNLRGIVSAAKGAGKKVVVSNLPALGYCDGGVGQWNARIQQVTDETGSQLRDVSDFSNFADDRHPADFSEYNTKTFAAVGCPGATAVGTAGSGEAPPGVPTLSNYELYSQYLAEGNSFQVGHEYYQGLGMIDRITRYLNLITGGAGSGLPGGNLVTDANGNVTYEAGAAEKLAGIYGCDDPINKQLEAQVGHPLDCIVPEARKGTEAYESDPLANFLCSKGYAIDGECSALQCIADSPATTKVGNLSCNIEMRDTSDDVAWAKVSDYISHYYLQQYNLDKNASQAWVGDSNVNESLYNLLDGSHKTLQQALIDNLGQAGFTQERNDRIKVTTEVVNHAKSLKLNPKFILTLWLEESGASAVGKRNLGCLYFIDGRANADIDPDTQRSASGANSAGYVQYLINKLDEQVDCVNSYVTYVEGKDGTTNDFNQFMCQYSGETTRPDCATFTNNPNFPGRVCNIYAELGGNASTPPAAGNNDADTAQQQLCKNLSGNNGCNTDLKDVALGWPLDNLPAVKISQGYGNIPGGRAGAHNAIDFAVPIGTAVYAAAPGVVVGIRTASTNYVFDAAGHHCPAGATCNPSNYILIKHTTSDGKSFWTGYWHVTTASVTVGEHVNLGQQIGTTGDNGDSGGPHLHFELRYKECYDGYGAGAIGSCSLNPACYLGSLPNLPANTACTTGTSQVLQCTGAAPTTPDPTQCLDPSSADYILQPVGRNTAIICCSEPTNTTTVNTGDLKTYNGTISLIPGAKQSMETMLATMKKDDPGAYATCGFNWGYRSAALQESFNECGTQATACKCHSEHQLGTTVDFAPYNSTNVALFKNTACYTWLTQNAADYGFVNSYTPGNPDYETEPWHWRWIGPELAKQFSSQSKDKYLINFLEGVKSSGKKYTL